jgi:hypothetical protein
MRVRLQNEETRNHAAEQEVMQLREALHQAEARRRYAQLQYYTL